MTQTTYDHSGRLLPSTPQRNDGYEYNITGTTRLGDEVYSDYGGRWLPVMMEGFHMPECLRYRRKKTA